MLDLAPAELVGGRIGERDFSALDLACAGVAIARRDKVYAASQAQITTRIQQSLESSRPVREYFNVGNRVVHHTVLLGISAGEAVHLALDDGIDFFPSPT